MRRFVLSTLSCTASCMINPAFDPRVDDGSTSTASTSSTTGTSEGDSDTAVESSTTETGAAAVCGNGIPEPGEACDDGDDEDGDGCNRDCVVSGTPVWELIRDAGSSGFDAAHDLTLFPDGGVAVAGTLDSDGLQVAELLRLSADGSELWTHRYSYDETAGTSGWGSARVGEVAVVAGYSALDMMFARAVDADGNELWTVTAPGSGHDACHDGNDEVWVAGSVPSGSVATWRIGGDGSLIATYDDTTSGLPYGVAWGIGCGNNRIMLAGESGSPSSGWLIELWSDGSQNWDLDVGFLGGEADAAYGATVAPGGGVAMVGDIDTGGTIRNGWLLRRDTGGRLLPAIVAPTNGNYHGVAIGPSGEIAIAGWIDQGLFKIAQVSKFAPDGTPAWTFERTGEVEVGEHKAWTIGIRDDGTVVVAGELVNATTGRDHWVAALAP